MHRALPLTIGISAGQAAPGLLRSIRAIVAVVDLAEVANAFLRRLLLGVAPGNLQELKWMFSHRPDYAACLRDSISEPSSAAFGFTSQNFGRNVR